MHECVPSVCLVPMEIRSGTRSPGTRVNDDYELPCKLLITKSMSTVATSSINS